MRLYFGSDAASWDSAQDKEVVAPEPVLDSLSFMELGRSEIIALSGQVSCSKSLPMGQMISQDRGPHFIGESVEVSVSSTRIDIGKPNTSSERSEYSCPVLVRVTQLMGELV